jgi:hypothetical protein
MRKKIPLTMMILAVPLSVAAGCGSSTPDEHQSRADGGSSRADAQSQPPVVQRSPLGAACSAGSACVSGFCSDGVCCDSACGQTCYACNQSAAVGHCAAMASGQDTNANATCTAPSACYLSRSATVPACKLVDGTACQVDDDCVSGHCLTFYADADGDGYGGSDQAHFCSELNAPPPVGYAAYTGDCCDLDAGANPGFDASQFLSMPDACGSFDWTCDGKVMQQQSCPTAIACGAHCTINLGFFVVNAFTQACN